jgi:DNA-3-methyladenine glycosylase I
MVAGCVCPVNFAAVKKRCSWANASPLDADYHDTEWGVPSHDDMHLFEMLILEGAQAGLSWTTILKKRAAYREAYEGFDPQRVAAFTQHKQAQLLKNAGIVRNRLKIDAALNNARAFLEVQAEHGSFASYIWGFVEGETLQNHWHDLQQIPAQTPVSVNMSKQLRKRGFSFVGPTICYAFMQSVGMVNDHVTDCFRYPAIVKASS